MTDRKWQPRHDDPLFIMAMDHRASFGKTLFDVKNDDPDPDQVAAMQFAKEMIFEGLRAALPAMTRGRAGVLVDERYGQGVIDATRSGRQSVVLAIPVEASGHDWITLEWGDHWLGHVEAISPDYAKVLVRDNPDFDPAEREQQGGQPGHRVRRLRDRPQHLGGCRARLRGVRPRRGGR
jgi:myo-inositol catabolism protein IolC